jgi:hypothetical protein
VALAEALDVTLLTLDARLARAHGSTCRIEVLGGGGRGHQCAAGAARIGAAVRSFRGCIGACAGQMKRCHEARFRVV